MKTIAAASPAAGQALATGGAALAEQLAALRRIALAVARPSIPSAPSDETLLHGLLTELTQALPAAAAMVAVFADDTRTTLRTLAVRLDGRALPNFEYPVRGSPCQHVVGAQFRYVARGVLAEVDADNEFTRQGLDAYAAFPLNDSHGAPLGVLAVLDREPIAAGDAAHAEVMLKVVAGRLAGELEGRQTLAALHDAALAVSAAGGETVFGELARMLASSLQVEFAFIARHDPGDPEHLTMVALHGDGNTVRGIRYAIAPTPCRTVLGQQFRAYPRDLALPFPEDPDVRVKGAESYAGLPLTGLTGEPLGVIAVCSRRPLVHISRIEAMLKIFAVRAAAEVERLRALEALRMSEVQYRAIFDASADALILWDSQYRRVDVNRAYERLYGWSREEVVGRSYEHPAYPAQYAEPRRELVRRALAGETCRLELEAVRKDGTRLFTEVQTIPFQHRGEPHVLAIARDITERRAADARLRAREEQYRAIFDGSVDPMVLYNNRLEVADVNAAFVRVTGLRRDALVGRHWSRRPDAHDMAKLVPSIEAALAGRTVHSVERVSHADGVFMDMELRYLPVNIDGETHVLGIGRNVSELLERERELGSAARRGCAPPSRRRSTA